ncbi:MAG: LysM peptidoglycan-binding domain-containing protein [Candidatus Caldatribacteriota bacterium]|nr:LysM peptidoglycan-binding domain-containing protein [Candidatus Caldatribacteriota bacterium]
MHLFQKFKQNKSKVPMMILLLLSLVFFTSLLSQAAGNSFISHTVVKGESLWSISQQCQIPIKTILAINNIEENDLLSIGQVIKISQNSLQGSDYSVHVVKKGETLWSISRKYNLTVNSIIAINNFTNSELISIGQQIRIPSFKDNSTLGKNMNVQTSADNNQDNSKDEEIEPVTYIVKPGDNLWNIAQKFGVSIATITAMNNLTSKDLLSINQKLEIPGVGGGLPETNQKQEPTIVTYTVVKGDTLWSISKRYDVKMTSIISNNNLKKISQLSIGKKLKIPITNMDIAKAEGNNQDEKAQEIIYYVKKGESLWSISRKYNVKLDTIIATNNITDASKISSGQRLIISKVPGARSSICNFIWPVRGRVTSPFGQRVLNGRKEFHTGIDIGSPIGTKIVAAESGKVSYAGYMRGYGNVIIISHSGGYSTVYGHNSVNLVKKGQFVKKGSMIGKIGLTGYTTGPHLHFEVRLSGKPRNPLPYLK